MGLMSFTHAAPFFVIVGIVFAAFAAGLRVWGSAYLGPTTVIHRDMQAGAVMAAGPYRFMRNPLYLGLWFMVAAMALVMPPSGALFSLVFLSLFVVRLILGEEAFLAAQLGEPYRIYRIAVPRFLPRLRPILPRVAARPQWFHAFLAEIGPIGVFVTLALFSWSYDNMILMKGILISFGISLVVRALVPAGEPHFSRAS
jgi:Phospholipid methyltransferase